MSRSAALILAVILTMETAAAAERQTITFPSEDGVTITADLYLSVSTKHNPFIVLFHQAGWSRGEYLEIAPRLNDLGFNCMAVDLRSGKGVNGVTNETAKAARKAGKTTSYVDALVDIRAALHYVSNKHIRHGKLIAWGSSYSSGLVLYIAGTHPKLLDGVLAFAPGEYYRKQGKPAHWIRSAAATITVPAFITSAKSEKKNWWSIYQAIPGDDKRCYLPKTRGQHGSRALWKKFPDSPGYWNEVELFLQQFKPTIGLPVTR